jgi:hypothetical protein
MMWLTRLMPYAISALVGLAGSGILAVNVAEQPALQRSVRCIWTAV